MRITSFLILLLILLPARAHEGDNHAEPSAGPPLILGVLDFPTSGKPEAQEPFETGVKLLHSFEYEDARAAWDWIAREYPQQRRYIFGHSLGSAIAVELASQVNDASGLIVEGSFTSIPDVFTTQPWGWLPLTGLITQRFDAASRIGKVRVPVLVVHGSDDSLIPARLGRALYEQAQPPKRFVLVEGGSHHNANALGQAQYAQALHELFGPAL